MSAKAEKRRRSPASGAVACPGKADEYEKYNYDVGIKPLIEKALGVQTFREDREH